MRNRLGLIAMVSIALFAFLFLVACTGNNSETSKSDSTIAVAKDSAALSLPRYNLTGYLDTLWMTVPSFQALTKRVTFRFYIKNLDTLTLRGWSGDSYRYNPIPDVILYNGHADSSVKFGPDNYFGNLLLLKADIKKINSQINSDTTHPRFVLFVPQMDNIYMSQISYTILLTNDNPILLTKNLPSATTPTGVNTNPSPPRNGY